MSRENLSSGCPTRSDTIQTAKPQKMARGWKFWNKGVEELYYLCSENKVLISYAVTAQLICAFVVVYAKSRFSHNAAPIELKQILKFDNTCLNLFS